MFFLKILRGKQRKVPLDYHELLEDDRYDLETLNSEDPLFQEMPIEWNTIFEDLL